MTSKELFEQIQQKKSFLCIGLDADIDKIPKHLLKLEDPVFEFNKQIIESTKDLCVAYKPNISFYESMGPKGWESLRKTLEIIPKNIFTIADAKRGDIGNTSKMYAKTFFKTLSFDSVTVAPYMGSDSVKPFLSFNNKWVILLALTSNDGGLDFQLFENENGEKLYQKVLNVSKNWGENLMYVVGATRADALAEIRKIVPNKFLLIPGVGAQGGSLEDVCEYGLNDQCGLLINSSRGIIYASDGIDFAKKSRLKALELQSKMKLILENKFA
jgi:orotidine-5'-phosphate decarboxylase